MPLLLKMTRVYGACAILARIEARVIGQLRFYPKVVCDMKGAGGLCLLQKHPNGPADDFAASDFPPLEKIEDKTLSVHCLMTGSSQQEENPYQRKGIGSLMVKELIQWAKSRGWQSIEADAFEDIPLIYQITGSAGQNFWKKLGFHAADRYPHPYLQEPSEFLEQLEEQARSMGITPEKARDKIVMRLVID